MFNAIKKLFTKQEPTKPVKAVQPEQPKKPKKELSEKELATLNNEPYIKVINTVVDPENPNTGYFEFDYNDKFVLNLIRHGYKQKDTDTDAEIVDRWYTELSRNIVLEMYEQQQADPSNRVHRDMRVVTRKNLGDGRSEIS